MSLPSDPIPLAPQIDRYANRSLRRQRGTRYIHHRSITSASLAAIGLVLALTAPVEAYIGPGAGIALVSSFFVVFLAVLSALLTLMTWPIRWIIRAIRGRRAMRNTRVRRVVILGLDGMEPSLAERFMAEGKMPNLTRLAEMGTFARLGTTMPPLSPVAWSSFLTGVNPGKHNIFDFLTRDPKTYLPNLSSVQIREPTRSLCIGRYVIPLSKPEIKLLRGSRPFWNVLGDHGIPSTIIRVPITWPPEKFRGNLLSAMCVPDLRGSQGMFSYYSTNADSVRERTGGEQLSARREGDTVYAELIGPPNSIRRDLGVMKCPFRIRLGRDGRPATLYVNGHREPLTVGRYTPWIRVCFKAGLGIKAYGICQFLLRRTEPDVEIYVTPINIDPEKPVMPIGHPSILSNYYAKRIGPYATLGLAEDTWALNEELLTDDEFLHQCLEADAEREKMWFDALEKTPRGLVCCVFDGTDRIQHTFWRYLDREHPAHPSKRGGPPSNGHDRTIEELYVRMDLLVGETMKRVLDDKTVLMVISDHGFNAFRRGIDLNRWLIEHGYMVLKPGAEHESYLRAVDWSATRAYALGLAGMWINQRGRESRGIVTSEDAMALRKEIAARLGGLIDPQTGQPAIVRVYDARDVYKGPYRDNAPDLIVGYAGGYRVDWDTAIGKVTNSIFHDNRKAWSGDHCIDPSLIPGVLFCNRRIASPAPRLMDLGATSLNLFGIAPPPYMDGRALEVGD